MNKNRIRGASRKGPNRLLATYHAEHLAIHTQLNPPNRRMRTRMYGGVGGEDERPPIPTDLQDIVQVFSLIDLPPEKLTRELRLPVQRNYFALQLSFFACRFRFPRQRGGLGQSEASQWALLLALFLPETP
jgi:hypothetical protein